MYSTSTEKYSSYIHRRLRSKCTVQVLKSTLVIEVEKNYFGEKSVNEESCDEKGEIQRTEDQRTEEQFLRERLLTGRDLAMVSRLVDSGAEISQLLVKAGMVTISVSIYSGLYI